MIRQGALLNDPSDVKWLRDTHLKTIAPWLRFRSFIIYGNEDCPEYYDLYAESNPLISSPYIRLVANVYGWSVRDVRPRIA